MQALGLTVDDQATNRALDELAEVINAPPKLFRSPTVVDLAVGANRVAHGLGRIPVGASVTPTTADATWAWALTSKDSKFVVITTVGVVQTGATVEVF